MKDLDKNLHCIIDLVITNNIYKVFDAQSLKKYIYE